MSVTTCFARHDGRAVLREHGAQGSRSARLNVTQKHVASDTTHLREGAPVSDTTCFHVLLAELPLPRVPRFVRSNRPGLTG